MNTTHLRQPARIHRHTRVQFHLKSLLPWLLLLIISLLLLTGCEVDQKALQRDPFMRDMMQLQQQTTQSHHLGQTFEVGNTRWNIHAAHASLHLRIGSDILLKAHGKFITLDLTFTNLTDTPQHPTADMLQIEDATLHLYKSDGQITAMLAGWQKTHNFLTEVFQPNQAQDCSLVFDLPTEASGLTLLFQSFPTQDTSPSI